MNADTSEDEDTDDALMMTAVSEVVEGKINRKRMRTVSTVSECSDEFSKEEFTGGLTELGETSLISASSVSQCLHLQVVTASTS